MDFSLKKKQLFETKLKINNTVFWMQEDGRIYKNYNLDVFYELYDFNWDGPQYKRVIKTKTTGTNEAKTKTKGRLTGAVIGTVILPGAGTVLGALHGTGKKTVGTNQQNTVSYAEDVELSSQANLMVKNVESGISTKMTFMCDSALANRISSFVSEEKPKLPPIPSTIDVEEKEDPYEELKKLKELLDLGIISEDEFNQKKKELLDL